MSDETEGSKIAMLRECERKLLEERDIALGRLASMASRLAELRQAIDTLMYAKPKRGRSIPPATQPGGYDDSVSIDEAQGILVRGDAPWIAGS